MILFAQSDEIAIMIFLKQITEIHNTMHAALFYQPWKNKIFQVCFLFEKYISLCS